MKRYHGQKTKTLGIIAAISIIGIASLNGALRLVEATSITCVDNATCDEDTTKDKMKATATQEVQFTFNPTLKFEAKTTNLEVEDIIPGAHKTSATPAKMTISTNNANGYYISVGAVERDTLDRQEGGDYKIKSLPSSVTDVTYANAGNLPINTWALACANYQSADTSKTDTERLSASKFFGVSAAPDDPTKAQTDLMQKAINVDSSTNGETTVLCGIGIRAGNTLPQGTYTGTVKFYAVVK